MNETQAAELITILDRIAAALERAHPKPGPKPDNTMLVHYR